MKFIEMFHKHQTRQILLRSHKLCRIIGFSVDERIANCFTLNDFRIGSMNQLSHSDAKIPLSVFCKVIHSTSFDIVQIGADISLTLTNETPCAIELELDILDENPPVDRSRGYP